MRSLLLGKDRETGKAVYLDKAAFQTHLHIPGTTGTGKTTLILSMLKQLLADPFEQSCHVIFDFLGGLSWDLMLWMSSRYCTERVRSRLVYIEPANPDFVIGLNPLLYERAEDGYFKVNRATELILRAWQSQNIQEMPRLSRWLFNSFWASAQLGLTIADTEHLLLPGSPYHKPLLHALPQRLRYEWESLLQAKGSEAERMLESSRNRLKPFYESAILRRMFGSTLNRLDVLRFMRENKIVLINLSPMGRLSPPEANAIAGLINNEVLAAARSLPVHLRGQYPTFLWLDEFQRMVGQDLEFAIPEVRQLGLRLILAHQTFGQLKRDDLDLTPMIFLPRTRFAFALAGEDAEVLANEFASLTFDAKRIKDEQFSTRQIQVGHKLVELESWGTNCADVSTWNETYGTVRTAAAGIARRDGSIDAVRSVSGSDAENRGRGLGGSSQHSSSHTRTQHLIAELDTFLERSSVTYYSFDEQRQLWASKVRKLRTGSMVAWMPNQEGLSEVLVDNPKHGHLALSAPVLHKRLPQTMEAVERLKERNFAADMFVSPAVIERETQERLDRVLKPVIPVQTSLPSRGSGSSPSAPFDE